jgi:hypothetical protein
LHAYCRSETDIPAVHSESTGSKPSLILHDLENMNHKTKDVYECIHAFQKEWSDWIVLYIRSGYDENCV